MRVRFAHIEFKIRKIMKSYLTNSSRVLFQDLATGYQFIQARLCKVENLGFILLGLMENSNVVVDLSGRCGGGKDDEKDHSFFLERVVL